VEFGSLSVSCPLPAPFASSRPSGISITLKHATEWGAFGHVHGVITGYQKNTGAQRGLHGF
jgi:hypothetical protein